MAPEQAALVVAFPGTLRFVTPMGETDGYIESNAAVRQSRDALMKHLKSMGIKATSAYGASLSSYVGKERKFTDTEVVEFTDLLLFLRAVYIELGRRRVMGGII